MKKIKSFEDLQLEDGETLSDLSSSIILARKDLRDSSGEEKRDRRTFKKKNIVDKQPGSERRQFFKKVAENKELLLRRNKNSWIFKVGDEVIHSSTHFNVFKKAEEGAETFKFYCHKNTWRGAGLIKLDGKHVIVPTFESAVTFLEYNPPKGGSSELVGVESADETNTEIVEGPSYTDKEKNKTGLVISHNGPVYATFKLSGDSIEDNRTVIVEITMDGKYKRIR